MLAINRNATVIVISHFSLFIMLRFKVLLFNTFCSDVLHSAYLY